MANSVDSSLVLPHPDAVPNGEILADRDDTQGRQGWRPVLRSINTLYEKKRGQQVNIGVFGTTPQVILDNTGQTARYRVRVQGRSGIAFATRQEDVWVFCHLELTETASGSCVLTVTDAEANDTITYTYTTNIDAWVEVGEFRLEDDAEYVDIEMAFTTRTNMSVTKLKGVSIFYVRDRTSLPYYAGLGYPTNGFIPFDAAFYAPEMPLSTWMLYAAHKDLESLWSYRVNGCICAAQPSGVTGRQDLIPAVYSVYLQPGVDTITIHLYGSGFTGASKALSWGYVIINGVEVLDDTDWSGTQWKTVTLSGYRSNTGRWVDLVITSDSAATATPVYAISIYQEEASRP